MDAHTLDLLEFDKIRELVAGYAFCSLGKDLARQATPSTHGDSIRAEIALVSEMADVLGEGNTPPLAGLHDVRLLTRRAAIGAMLSADQLLEVAATLTCTGNVYRFRMRLGPRYQRLIALLAPVDDLGLVAKSIAGCIDARGHVLDMASPELGLVRQKIADLDERVQHRIRHLLRDPELRKVLRYANATVSGDHYVLPVAVNYRHKVPGVVHRTSSTGETIFVEPAEVAGLSAQRVLLKTEEEREVNKVLRKLSAEVGRVARPLGFAVEAMARLDYVCAKAKFSRAFHHAPPDINTDGKLWLRQARHPLLEQLFRNQESGGRIQESGVRGQETQFKEQEAGRTVVPIDVRLGNPFNLLIITGPNTGGKTVTLKTMGLLCLMAQTGMHIPAGQGSAVPVFSDILADIGDEQSLEQSLSTFSSHMSRIAHILKTADSRSLVLLDELGAGTDPIEGAALGRAILDQIDHIGCRAMVTTHLGDLKTYAFSNERAENAAVEFDVETLQPTFRLHIGQFGMSNALEIARRLKLPKELLRRAHRYLRRRQRRAPELAQLQQKRAEAEKARAEALQAQHEAQKQRDEFEHKLAQLEREAREAAALKVWRSKLQAGDPVRVPKYDKTGKIVRVDHKKNQAAVSLGLGQWEVSLEEVFPDQSEKN
ncbi:MAG: DNA strand exchange inhibitor protein [Gemmataceae bacterium]|nr:DNA strand exchange inhibitor protein [Gemmataceae bacterium]MCI0742662.1 DNA strand exchange inhibitor protein [Gemmataceae bacterium]